MSKIIDEGMDKLIQALQFKGEEEAPVEVEAEKEEIGEVQTNANELMHTTNTGFGEELIPVEVLTEQVLDLIPKYSTFLGSLPGFHGTNMPISAKVPIIGETGFFSKNTEPTTGAQAIPQPSNRLATGEIQIDQAPLIADVFLTKRQLNYSVGQLESLVRTKLAEGLARTIEAMILNADTATGSTGNINSDDQAPATTYGADHYSLILDNGLRKLGLAATGVDAGTLDMGDFLSVINKIGDFAANPADCLWVFNRATYNKALGLDAFAKANERGQSSVIAGNAISNVYGSDLFIARDMPKTEADGKMSYVAGNNIKGGFLYFYKPAVQYGYGQPFELELTKVAGKGIQLTATCEFGFAIANEKAGQADKSVGLAMNVTL